MTAEKQPRRVVVTGLGAITPLGASASESWQRAQACESGIGPITLFDARTFPGRIAGEVSVPLDDLSAIGLHLNRPSRLGVMAADEAIAESGLADSEFNPDRLAVVMGSGRPGPDLTNVPHLLGTMSVDDARDKGFPLLRGRSYQVGVDAIARRLNARGPTLSVYTACSSGAQAIGEAVRIIQRGDADIAVAWGYDSMVHEIGIIAFSMLRVLSTDNDSPTTACKPFDRDRTGMVLGEGAAAVVLEEADHARRRGATILAEVVGYGSSLSGYRITDPEPDAAGPIRAIEMALSEARALPEQIDTDGDRIGDTTFSQLIAEVESILNDENATKADLERAKDLAESVNVHDEGNSECDNNTISEIGISTAGDGAPI
jgi:3-oxoacyl-[acyl-carrier-protein] synthase II